MLKIHLNVMKNKNKKNSREECVRSIFTITNKINLLTFTLKTADVSINSRSIHGMIKLPTDKVNKWRSICKNSFISVYIN